MSAEEWGELADDGNSEMDGRADIYSLGIVFYELVAGRRPFSGLTLVETGGEHGGVVPKSLNELDVSVPEGFSSAIARAIAKDRSQRQASADELEQELRSALAAEGIAPGASALSTRGPPPEAATSETGPADRRPITAAERTAPTIVSEGALTADESGEEIQSQAGTMPTMIAGQKPEAEPGFAGTPQPTMAVHSQSAAALPQPSAPARRRSPLPFVAIGIVILLLVVGAGGYAVIHFMSSSANTNSAKTDPSKSATTTDPALGGHEVGRYWLEVDTKNKADAVRAGDSVVMQSGQSFRFHFSPSQNGYLYIIGPGNKRAPTTFLATTARAQSGVLTNYVQS